MVDQELLDARADVVPDLANLLERLAGRVRDLPVFDGRRHVGHGPLQASVTAQSACSCISTVSFFGTRPERSKPSSAIASTTTGCTSAAGSSPADSAWMSGGARLLKNASAI